MLDPVSYYDHRLGGVAYSMDIDIVDGALGIVRWGRRLIDGDGGAILHPVFYF